jgi:serine/threonine protein kinase
MQYEASLGSRFGLVRKIGSGGMGIVYEAVDHETNAIVAIKTLRSFDADLLLRLKREFRELADLQHPNLVRFGELYCESDQWFFTMELVRGRNFFEYVRLQTPDGHGDPDEHPTMPVPQALRDEPWLLSRRPPSSDERGYDEPRLRAVAGQLASALHALHRSGHVHRDIKPSNVMVGDDGRLVLLDFGLIERIRPESAGADGPLYGTPHFVSPEQILGRNAGPEADWYAFGVMLFLALTGRLPFAGLPPLVVEAKTKRDAPSPSQLCADVPLDLDELCQLLLARDPGDRPRGDEVLRRLHAEVEPEPLPAASADVGEAPSAFVGRGAELAELAAAWARVK